jgi:hypothetical protein
MIIASRNLRFSSKNREIDIPICLHAPENAGASWACRYEIGWPEGRHVMKVEGFDAFQALMIALQMIGTEIYTSDYHKAGQLNWPPDKKGYGFPIASNLRDLLEGEDARFF